MSKRILCDQLRQNSYPGRGIILGRSADSSCAVIAYFIMGRSENSRNRIFSATDDGIRTEPYDTAKLEDPSLIIYRPVRLFQGQTIITNGDQTDTIYSALSQGRSAQSALMTRTFEPDAPNYTPRISGVLYPDGSYDLSILKSLEGNPSCCCRYFYTYRSIAAGEGHFIHTYMGDDTPLPSFEGEPEYIEIKAPDAKTFAGEIWDSLNEENKVSLFVRYLNLKTGKMSDVIINKHH